MHKCAHEPVSDELHVDENKATELSSGYNYTNGFNNIVPRYSEPVGIYLLKINNRNTRKRCEICSKLIIKTPVRGQKKLLILKLPIKIFFIKCCNNNLHSLI